MESHEDTHTYPMHQLGTLIIVVIVVVLFISVYYIQIAEGTTEMDAQLKCKQMGDIRHRISEIELSEWIPGQTSGQTIVSNSLLDLPPGCGKMYDKPCANITDCQEKIQKSLGRCWENIQQEPETTGTCLFSLEINGSISGNSLSKANVCGGGTTCQGTEVPMDVIYYDPVPQGNDTIAMEYGKTWLGFGGKEINVKCLGKCKPP